MYMKPRKMVLKNISAGQEQRLTHRQQTRGRSGGRRGWDEQGKKQWNMYTIMCETASGSCSITQVGQFFSVDDMER